MPPKKNKKHGKRKKIIEMYNHLETDENQQVLMKSSNVSPSSISVIKTEKKKMLNLLPVPDGRGEQGSSVSKGTLKKLEGALFEWYSVKESEGCRVSGSMIIERAKFLSKEMTIKSPCAFSNKWLSRFKLRYGIRQVDAETVDCEEESMISEAPKIYCEFFSTLIAEHDLSAEQIYSACEFKMLWRSLHESKQVYGYKTVNDGLVNIEESLSLLVCANASGRHKLKLFAVGNDELKSSLDKHDSSIVYNSQSGSVLIKELYLQWFEMKFVPSVKLYLKKIGKSEDSKVLLLLDNSTRELLDCDLECGNIFTVFLPNDVTSMILPMNQGVIHDLKCNYRIDVMKKFCSHEITVQYFISQYSIEDATHYLAGAWESVNTEILKKAWKHLLPRSLMRERY